MTEAFQGTMLAWARKIGAFSSAEPSGPTTALKGRALTNAWISWARAEELRRLAQALYIHDAETASVFNREPLLRHQGIVHPPTISESVFNAASPEEWQKLYFRHRYMYDAGSTNVIDWTNGDHESNRQDALSISIENSAFTAYSTLANIGACIAERANIALPESTNVLSHGKTMSKWYRTYHRQAQKGWSGCFCLKALWQYYSALLYADFELLERALDAHSQPHDVSAASSWALSDQAPSALLHMCMLQKHASEQNLGSIPPIHLPRIVYAAGLGFFAYFHFAPKGQDREQRQAIFHGWKTRMLNTPYIDTLAAGEGMQPSELLDWACGLLANRGSSLSYGCLDILRKLNRWGVAEVLASKLQVTLHTALDSGNLPRG